MIVLENECNNAIVIETKLIIKIEVSILSPRQTSGARLEFSPYGTKVKEDKETKAQIVTKKELTNATCLAFNVMYNNGTGIINLPRQSAFWAPAHDLIGKTQQINRTTECFPAIQLCD